MRNLTSELAYWINERYAMKLRKETPEFQLMNYGYSPDLHMGTVRYCNVHREDDRVTLWVRQNWTRAGDPAWRFVLGRMVNLPETLGVFLRCSDLATMKSAMVLSRLAGNKVWTAAYTVSTCGRPMDKIDYVFDHVVTGVMRKEESGSRPWVDSRKTCRDSWLALQTVDGLGSFFAAQVVADMKNTPGHPLHLAEDWWTFSAHGPGSLRGLSWYFFGEPEGASPSSYQRLIRDCRAEVDPLIANYVPRISDQDFQNCLCEFSKYCKVRYLHGHVRNRYVPHIQSH